MTFYSGERLVLPGLIDVHAHLREPGGVDKETIASGTLAALHGGYQAVYDMPNNPAPYQTWTEYRLQEKSIIAQSTARTNIGFYAGVDLNSPNLEELARIIDHAAGLKLYMGHTTGNAKEFTLDSARESIDKWINESKTKRVKPPILLHARDGIGHETAEYIARNDHPVHWCHLASKAEVDFARKLNRSYPSRFFAGVTPHHLTMTQRNADFQQGWHGARMQPPLGEEADAEALLDAYNEGSIKILETDHAPHTHDDKLLAEIKNPTGKTDVDCTTCFGISGIEFVLPVMMSLVQRKMIRFGRLIDSLHRQPILMLGLDRVPGSKKSTTEIVVEPRILGESDRVGMSSNHPYLGWTGWARVSRVIIDETLMLQDKKLVNHLNPRILSAGSIIQ